MVTILLINLADNLISTLFRVSSFLFLIYEGNNKEKDQKNPTLSTPSNFSVLSSLPKFPLLNKQTLGLQTLIVELSSFFTC